MANQHTTQGRSVQYRLRLTDEEKRALDARAAAEGVTLADLIRGALGLAEAPTVHAGDPIAALLSDPAIKSVRLAGTAGGQQTRRK